MLNIKQTFYYQTLLLFIFTFELKNNFKKNAYEKQASLYLQPWIPNIFKALLDYTPSKCTHLIFTQNAMRHCALRYGLLTARCFTTKTRRTLGKLVAFSIIFIAHDADNHIHLTLRTSMNARYFAMCSKT